MRRYISLVVRLVFLAMVTLAMAGAVAYGAETLSPAVIKNIGPAPKHANLDQTIAGLLTHYHYGQSTLDDTLSEAVFDAYLQSLDFNRLYFLAEDIERFRKKYRFTLDNHLQSGNLQPAYEIFNIYLQRLAERTARLRVQMDRSINFNVDESLDLDREEASWVHSRTEMDEIWRKRIKHELLQLMTAGQDLEEAQETLLNRYEGRLRRTAQSNSEDVFQIYMNSVSRSFDPHTAYFSPRTSENFNIQMRLSLEGIGTVLRMEEEQITVVELVPGGPASISKQMKPNDKIVGVGQGDNEAIVDVVGWRLDDVVDLIRGPKGSVVRLQLISANAPPGDPGKAVRLVRDTIKLEKQAAKGEIRTINRAQGELKIGMITIPTFYSDFAAAQRGDTNYRSTTRDVRRIIDELEAEGAEGIVIDLRQNGGGSLQEAVGLTGLFIKEGPVVQVRNHRGSVDIEEDPDPTLIYDGPLAVLVNRFSASASEIFAGAIQDYGRGLVIGAPTFGKGTVQTLVDLNRFLPKSDNKLGQLKLTVAKFYRVNGSSTQNRGVVPDILFPSAYSDDEVGESSQEHALPWDEISPIQYQMSYNLKPLLPKLITLHDRRMTKNSVYQQLLEDIDKAKEARNDSTVSLVEQVRLQERETERNEQLRRENKLRVAQGLDPLANLEELDNQEDDDSETPDVLLEESAEILVDLITLMDSDEGQELVTVAQ